jgi:SAM-dependent methyltransferase
MSRIPAQIEMARWILEMGGKVEGKTFFEVGTGHNPIVPIGFFLCGAEKVVTVDLHRRLDFGILKKSLVWMAENRDEICGYYEGVANPQIAQITQIDKRMDLIDSLKGVPEKFLSEANIQYLAPADAANTDLPDESVDYHISTTVFEHIPGDDIKRILKEAKRILKKDGIAIHFIDLSDHFQHQDKSITSINFLRYSEKEWDKIAGNEFAYCNRLRASDYLTIFEGSGFDVCRKEVQEDKEARRSMENGFIIDERFRDSSVDDLCATGLRVALKENREAACI